MSVTRKEIIETLSNIGLGKRLTSEILDYFFNLISDKLSRGEDVRLVGFGKFYIVKKKKGTYFDPVKKEFNEIPERVVVKFRPSTSLRNALKEIPTE